jgi:hypothetical protein
VRAALQVCLLTNPIWLIKTRLQLQNSTLTIRNSGAGLGGSAAAPPSPGAPTLPITPLQAAAAAGGSQLGAAGTKAGGGAAGPAPHPSGATASAGRQYKGFFDALVRIGKEEGVGGYYKGLAPSLLLVSERGVGL